MCVCMREEEQKLKDRLYKLMMINGMDGRQTAGPFEKNINKGEIIQIFCKNRQKWMKNKLKVSLCMLLRAIR